jgi:predicted DNA-binding transcriptional regulator YafY
MGRDPLRGVAFTRLWKLVEMLNSRRNGVEVEEAAEELGIGRRTIYRDFLVLESSGFPLTADHEGRRARWKLMDSYRHRLQLSLTWPELFALMAAQRTVEGLSGTIFHDSLKAAVDKIRATLPRDLASRWSRFAEMASAELGGRNYRLKGDALRTLTEAIEARRTVVARYRPLGPKRQKRSRRLDPYHLHVAGDGIYLLAWCHSRKSLRTFLLDRFDSVERTDHAFELRGDVQSELEPAFQMWSGRARKVRFVVSPQVAQLLLERKPHPSAVTQRLTDDRAEVRMSVAIGPPLIAYLTGLGAKVRGIEPEELREAVREQHTAALEPEQTDLPLKSAARRAR